jgi:hypothetical protein
MIRAWLYLLQAEFHKEDVDYHYRDASTGQHIAVDGEPKAWDLSRCLAERFTGDSDPVRKNVELFIALRNKIEHRYQRAIQVVTGGRAHALVVNFQTEMVAAFGAAHSLGDKLRFPIFVQSLTEAGTEEMRRLQRSIPRRTSAYLARYESGLSQAVLDDVRYDLRVRLVPLVGPKTEADMAINFINLDKVTEEERATLLSAGREGTVITKAKHVEVASKGKMLPSEVVRRVNERVPYMFTMDHHTRLRKHFGVRPAGRTGDRSVTDQRYCVYDEPFKAYIYTEAWVDKIVREVGTTEAARNIFGRTPRAKVTALTDVRAHTGTGDALNVG